MMRCSNDQNNVENILCLSTLGLVMMVLSACGAEPATVNREENGVDRSIVASAKGRVDIDGGVIRLAARRDGVIAKVWVDEGAQVKAGEILASLDDTLATKNLDLARSEALQAEHEVAKVQIRLIAAAREVARLSPLAQKKTIPQHDLDRATDELALAHAELLSRQTAVDTAGKRVAIAESEIEDRRIRAPMNGEIVQRQARPGNGVSTLNVTPLFLFAPNTTRIVRAELEERFIGVVKLQQEVEILLEAEPTQRWRGRVLRIGKIVGQRTPTEDPAERQDNRIVETVLTVEKNSLLIGQRVIVRFLQHASQD